MGAVRTLITGASSGLGEGMARLFAARGYELALCARRTDRLDALAGELDTRVVTAPLDVTDHDAVTRVFSSLRDELGGLDRVIVNAGLGKGAPVGTGRADANRATVTTNLLGGLAQCEAAMEIFRAAGTGHLVVVSSVAAERGLRGSQSAYAASKAGLSVLAEGIRADVAELPIDVTTLAPGYIASEMTSRSEGRSPLIVDTETGCRAMVEAIDARVAHAYVPGWPWAVLGPLLGVLPMPVLRRLT